MKVHAAAIVAALLSTQGFAHHSFVSEYDGEIPLIKEGTISRISWVNPHAYIYINVENEDGQIEEWALEGFPVTAVRRQGFGRNDVKVGDRISAVGWPSRNGTPRMQAYELTLPDGSTEILGPRSGGLPEGYIDPAIREAEEAPARAAADGAE